jgi:DNA-binding response OmpR family regulator
MSNTILVVEDDRATRTFLADNLQADGFEPHVAHTLDFAWRVLAQRDVDLAIVDVGLGDGSGLDLVRRVRAADRTSSSVDPELPVLVLSGRGTEIDRVRGLQHGADDYVTKPFSYPEVRSRIEAILRRSAGRPREGRLRVGDLVVDPESREARIRGRRVDLSQKEFSLLHVLAREPFRVFSREELLREVWGYQAMGQTRTLDSHACRLRHKLGERGGRWIVNVWGVGYRLVERPQDGEEGR